MTREIPLTKGYVAIVDDEDYDRVLAAGPWHAYPGHRTTYAKHSYSRAEGRPGQHVTMHALVLGATFTDHVDGNGLNNTRANLRPTTRSENAANRPPRIDSTSGFKGVFPNTSGGRPWRAQIGVDGRKRHLGVFDTAEAAARAYDDAAAEAFGEFARLNFPKEQTA